MRFLCRFLDASHAKENLVKGSIKLSKVFICSSADETFFKSAPQFAAHPVKVAETLRDCFGIELNNGKPTYVLSWFIVVLLASL